MIVRFLISTAILADISGCGPGYSPDIYASSVAQQANRVERGVIISVRTVGGTEAGGAAGRQVGVGPISAFMVLGGSRMGGIKGSAAEHIESATSTFEYIVRKPSGDLISVIQNDRTPLAVGQKVLVIAGTQARVVPDHTVPMAKTEDAVKADTHAQRLAIDGDKPNTLRIRPST